MKIFYKEEGIEFLVNAISRNNIVPIIGAGFTAGCPAYDGIVPNGDTMKKIMQDCIKKYSVIYKDVVDGYSFQDISEIFFDRNEVPFEVCRDVLQKNFTNVKLPQFKINFLNCWKYIYTINIDDAIEGNTAFKTILPYTNLRSEALGIIKKNNYVLKLHGDAAHECLHDQENIVFSSDQYISSLRHPNNAQIIRSIYSDYKQKNIIFIGCSLNDEPDLKSIYRDVNRDIRDTYIVQLRRNTPSGIDLKNLKKHGVNALLLVDDYDVFYKDLFSAVNSSKKEEITFEYKYKNPKTDLISDKDNILRDISTGRNPFDTEKGIFKIPNLYVQRDISVNILESISKENFFVIHGRRFSGKTYVLNYIIENTPKYDKFMFPSNTSFDDNFVESILDESKNSIFIFDSGSITSEVYTMILRKKTSIVGRNNKIIIVSNTNEDFLISRLNAKYYVVKNVFSNDEMSAFNDKADKLAFVRRKAKQTHLEYAYVLLKQHNIEISYIPKEVSSFTRNEQAIIFMLCVFNKVYMHEISYMNITNTEVNIFIHQNPILFEIIDCDPNEAFGKSIYKIVHNSRSILLNIVKTMSKEDVLYVILLIVNNLYAYDKQQYKTAIMFDTLNQLFGQEGAGHLIEYIYKNLEDVLYKEPHFWLQRAKSIYRLFRTDKEKLLIAVEYAQKAMNDSGEGKDRNIVLYLKSKFSAALIYCMLYNMEEDDEHKIHYQKQSIIMFHGVFIHRHGDLPKSIENLLSYSHYGENVYNSIVSICDQFISPENKTLYPIIVDNAISILQHMKNIKPRYNIS